MANANLLGQRESVLVVLVILFDVRICHHGGVYANVVQVKLRFDHARHVYPERIFGEALILQLDLVAVVVVENRA